MEAAEDISRQEIDGQLATKLVGYRNAECLSAGFTAEGDKPAELGRGSPR